MTCIAFDGKTIAADRQATAGELRCVTTKLRRLPNGLVAAITGDGDRGLVLLDWLEKGADPWKWPESQHQDNWARLLVWRDGHLYEYDQEPFGIVVEDPYMAWGSGANFAIGAMAMGANAIQAVEVAIKHCVSCGFGVDSFRVA